jgi:NADH:ubiquinone oxidoreductase subunit C
MQGEIILDEVSAVLSRIQQRFGEKLVQAEAQQGEIRLSVSPDHLKPLCEYLRSDPALAFDYPADLTVRDTGEQFILWYRLISMSSQSTLILTVALPRDHPEVSSLTALWSGLDWLERECFDLYGIRFAGHPDQDDPARMRILLPEDWEGFPFRKDYTPVFSGDPLHGPQETN